MISNANHLISIAPIGQVYYMRGTAFEALGYYKEALSDYKAGKKDGYGQAEVAYDALKAKMKKKK